MSDIIDSLLATFQNNRKLRYSLGVIAAAVFSILLISRGNRNQRHSGYRTTAQRLSRSNEIYERSITKRKALIETLGPASKMQAFPDEHIDPLHRMYMLWDFFPPAYTCPHELERIGVAGDGGKYVCGLDRLVDKDLIVYSIGVEQQSSFEAEILRRSSTALIWAYDWSVLQIGPEVHDDPALSPRVKFMRYRLDAVDLSSTQWNPETHTLGYLMAENGHSFIDILKMDIEGSEFDVLKDIVRKFDGTKGGTLPFGQLQLEIHGNSHDFVQWLEWFEMLEAAGLRPFFNELNYQDAKTTGQPKVIEYSFINIRGQHRLLNDKAP